MGTLTSRSGSALRLTVTATVPPSSALYVPAPKLTVTDGSCAPAGWGGPAQSRAQATLPEAPPGRHGAR